MNVGLKIVKCSCQELEGKSWEQIHLFSVNSNQINFIEKKACIFSVFPHSTMYGKNQIQIWGTFKKSLLSNDLLGVDSEYGEIEIAFMPNCFLKKGQKIIND